MTATTSAFAHSLPVMSSYLTTDVTELFDALTRENAPTQLAIIHDALLDAGCPEGHARAVLWAQNEGKWPCVGWRAGAMNPAWYTGRREMYNLAHDCDDLPDSFAKALPIPPIPINDGVIGWRYYESVPDAILTLCEAFPEVFP